MSGIFCPLLSPLPQKGALKHFCKQSRPRSGSSYKSCLIRVYSVCWWKYDKSDHTLVDLTCNFFVLCTCINITFFSCKPNKDIWDFTWDRKSYLTHVIIPRLSCEGCTLVVKWRHCYVKVTTLCNIHLSIFIDFWRGAQWLSGRVLDSRPKGCGLEPHQHHCVVVL